MRPTDVFEVVGPVDLVMEVFYLFKKILSYSFTDGGVARIFSNKFELFRVVDTLHTCLRAVFTEKKKWGAVELIFLLSPLAVRRMRREHPRKMSKNADSEHSLEELSTLHPCFINIFAVICGYLLFEKMW